MLVRACSAPKSLRHSTDPAAVAWQVKGLKEQAEGRFNRMKRARSPKKGQPVALGIGIALRRSAWVKHVKACRCCLCRLKYVQTLCVGSRLCLWPASSCDAIIAPRRARPMSADMKAEDTSRCAFNLQRHMSYQVYNCRSLVDEGILLCGIHIKTVSTYLACPTPGTFHLS